MVLSTLDWTLAPSLVHLSPPLDVVESALWGPEWVIATYKHPAMPAWAIEIARRAGGSYGWPVYLMSQVFVAAGIALTALIGRATMDTARGVAAALALFGLELVSWSSPNLNHNVVQIPFWLGAIWLTWQAVERRGLAWWAALGIVSAAGLYAKFSSGLILAVLGLWIVADARGRAVLRTPGPWLALGLFALLAAPLLRWLIVHDFQPMHYAATRAGEGGVRQILFVPQVALAAVPIAGALALAGLFGRFGRSKYNVIPATKPPLPADLRARMFVRWTTLAPLVLVLVGAVLGGSGLRASWAAPMLPMLAVLGIMETSRRFDARAFRSLAIIAAAVTVLIPLGYAGVVSTLLRPEQRPSRVNWPQAEIAAGLRAEWSRETGGAPLRIVAGEAWMAGMAGLGPVPPSILSEGDLSLSPWITPERLARDGALIVWDPISRGKPSALDALIAGRSERTLRIKWPRAPNAPDLVVHYVVLPPK